MTMNIYTWSTIDIINLRITNQYGGSIRTKKDRIWRVFGRGENDGVFERKVSHAKILEGI